MRRIFILAAILLLSLPSEDPRAEDLPEAVLILPFDSASSNPELAVLGEGIPDLVTAFLAPYDDALKIVDRETLDEIFAESSLSWEGYLTSNSASELGKLLQARYILRGTVSGSKGELQVNAFLYETESTRLVKSFEVEGNSSELTSLSSALASRLGAFFQAEVEELPALPADDDPEKSRRMIHGLGHYHNSQPRKAMTSFFKILESHPRDELARFWLGKSLRAAGMDDHAEIEFRKFLELHPRSAKAEEAREFLKSRSKPRASSHEE